METATKGSENAKDSEEKDSNSAVGGTRLRLSNLLEKIESFAKSFNASGAGAENARNSNAPARTSLALPGLEQMHSEIVSIQGNVEESRQFKEGEEVYSKWLELALQCCPDERESGEGNQEKDSVGESLIEDSDSDRRKCNRLIALAFNNRGYLKYLQVDFEGAMKDYTRSLRYDQKLSCAYYNRGLVTYRLAFFSQAVEDMKNAVKLDPSSVEFQEGLARVSEMLDSPTGHKFKLKCDAAEKGPL